MKFLLKIKNFDLKILNLEGKKLFIVILTYYKLINSNFSVYFCFIRIYLNMMHNTYNMLRYNTYFSLFRVPIQLMLRNLKFKLTRLRIIMKNTDIFNT